MAGMGGSRWVVNWRDMTRRQHAIKPECQTRRGGGKDGGSLSRHGHVPDSSSGADVSGGYYVKTDTTALIPEVQTGNGGRRRLLAPVSPT